MASVEAVYRREVRVLAFGLKVVLSDAAFRGHIRVEVSSLAVS